MQKNLGLLLDPISWKGGDKIPFFLQDLYVFYTVSILKKTCLLSIPKENDQLTPAAISKHLHLLQKISGFPCIYLGTTISSHNRQRLAQHGVQFVIPNHQIYLPDLGVNWTERRSYGQKHQAAFGKQLSPSSQMVVIYAITHNKREFTPLELARELKYTPMTMSRALNELESFDIAKTIRKGKERLIYFVQDPFEIWKQALPFLQNPVKKRIWLKLDQRDLLSIEKEAVLAGLSALDEVSMISSPSCRIYAVSLNTWKTLQRSRHAQILPNSEDADIELEVWSYNPLSFSKEGRVDPFSLYLSLKDLGDERVDAALEKMLKGVKRCDSIV